MNDEHHVERSLSTSTVLRESRQQRLYR